VASASIIASKDFLTSVGKIICINVLPFQFFPSHCLAPN
jgi:hypothetical protein